MAFSLRLTGLKWAHGNPIATHIAESVPGVKVDDRDARFRCMPENSSYLDYYAVLSVEEALEIVQSGEPLIETWMRYDANSSARRDFEAMQLAIRESDLVIAHYYEWESGLGD